MNRFENINKQKEAETQQRIAEERKKRSAVDQSSEQQAPSTKTTAPVEVKQEETPREPSPARPATPPPASESTTDTVDEPVEASQQPTQTDANEQGEDRMIGTVNVSALLRKPSDSSPSADIPDEEWDDDN